MGPRCRRVRLTRFLVRPSQKSKFTIPQLPPSWSFCIDLQQMYEFQKTMRYYTALSTNQQHCRLPDFSIPAHRTGSLTYTSWSPCKECKTLWTPQPYPASHLRPSQDYDLTHATSPPPTLNSNSGGNAETQKRELGGIFVNCTLKTMNLTYLYVLINVLTYWSFFLSILKSPKKVTEFSLLDVSHTPHRKRRRLFC